MSGSWRDFLLEFENGSGITNHGVSVYFVVLAKMMTLHVFLEKRGRTSNSNDDENSKRETDHE